MTGGQSLPAGPIGRVVSTRRLSLRANTALNIGGKGFSIVASLFTAPFIVHSVGLTTFGFWAVVSSLSQYASLLDFGVGTTLMRYVAQHVAEGDYEQVTRKGAAGMAIAVLFAACLLAATAATMALLPSAWTSGWPGGWRWALAGIGVNLACISVSATLQAFPAGLSRWDLQNVPLIAYQFVFAGAVVVTQLAGLGLAGLGLSVACAGGAMATVALVTARRVWRQPWKRRPARKDVRELLGYGANMQVANLVVVLNVQSDKPVLLAFGASLRFIAFYELASRVAFQLRSLPVMALGPMAAKVAGDAAGKDLAFLRRVYENMLAKMVVFAIAPLLGAYGICYPLIFAWLGTDYQVTATMMLVLGCGYAANLVTAAGSVLAHGCGRPQLDRNYSVLGLVINVVLTVALGAAFGPWGVIAATAIGLSVSSLWLLHSIDRWVGSRTLGRDTPLRQEGSAACAAVLAVTLTVLAVSAARLDARWEFLVAGSLSAAGFAAFWVASSTQVRESVLPVVSQRLRRT